MIAEITHRTIHNGGGNQFLSASVFLGGSGESTTNSIYNRIYYKNGIETSANPFDSMLVNGRARFDDASKTPYEIFSIAPGDSLHFVCAASDFSVTIKISEHVISIVELDGFLVEAKRVNYLMLSPGETARIIPIRDNAKTDSDRV